MHAARLLRLAVSGCLVTAWLSLPGCDAGGSGAGVPAPAPPSLTVTASPHALHFNWTDERANPDTAYLLQYSVDGGANYYGSSTAQAMLPVAAHLNDWRNTFVRLLACNGTLCARSAGVALEPLAGNTHTAIHSTQPDSSSGFASHIALSADGRTLAISEPWSDAARSTSPSDCTGVAPVNCLEDSGSVAVYTLSPTAGWVLQATLKASNAGAFDYFGEALALSASGDVLVVGAYGEDSTLTGTGVAPAPDACNGTAPAPPCVAESGAVYVFKRNGSHWTQRVYLKAEFPHAGDHFGDELAVSSGYEPLTVLVGAMSEDGGGYGTSADPRLDCDAVEPVNCRVDAGAVYVFSENIDQEWAQTAYIKQLDSEPTSSGFGNFLALSGNGQNIAVSRNGDNDSYAAVDFFLRDGNNWYQDNGITLSGPSMARVALAFTHDGSRLAVGSPFYNGLGKVFVISHATARWDTTVEIDPPALPLPSSFGFSIAINDLGTRLYVGAPLHHGNGRGFDSPVSYACTDADHDTCAPGAGAVFLYERGTGGWARQRMLKSRSTESFYDPLATISASPSADYYGGALATSSDGSRLVVGALGNDSGQSGAGGDGSDGCELLPVSNCVPDSGTVFVY